MSQKLPANNFEWIKDTSQYNEDFAKIFITSFIVYIKTDDIDKDIAEDVETGFDTSNYELDRPL